MTARKRHYWLNLAIALAFLAVIVFGFVTFRNSMAIRQSEKMVTHSYAAREATRELLASISDMQTGQRGYLLTKEPSYLEPYHAAIKSVESDFSRLRNLTLEFTSQQERLNKLQGLSETYREHLAKSIEARDLERPPDQTPEYLQLVHSGRGQELMSKIRSVVAEVLREEEIRLTQREAAAREQATISRVSMIAGNAIALSLLVLTSLIAHFDRFKRDQADIEMRTSREKMRAIFDSASDGIISFNTDLSIRLMNRAAANLHACDIETVEGRSILNFVPPALRQAVERELSDFLASNDRTRTIPETNALRDDGTIFPCTGSLSKSEVGDAPFATFMFRDLSQVKASQAKIYQQTLLLDEVSDAILVCDMNDEIIFWNRGSQELYGIPVEQAIGKNAGSMLFEDQSELWEAGRQQILEQGAYQAEISQHVPGRDDIVVEHRRMLVRDQSGEPSAQLILNLDVTDRKNEEARQRRSQRLESIGTLAGGIAHDLNNVLTPILMSGKLLRRGVGDQKGRIDAIVTSAERGGQMIKKLLSFAGGDQATRHSINIREIVLEVEEILRHSLPKSIELQVRVPSDLHLAGGDATELSQVLMNLAINARDAMPSGGHLEITADNFQVDDAFAKRSDILQAGSHVLLRIADDGEGMSQEIIDRIFDPFFTTKEQGKGTGLGLATTLGIVRSHGGEIVVYSEPGSGTAFSIYLPAEQSKSNSIIELEDGKGVPTGNGETILVVDDDAMIVDAACVTLETSGYLVLAATGGAEALQTYQTQSKSIDLVLVDMMMPGVDGFATKEGIRMMNPGACIIASSGLRHPRGEDQRMADVDGFLPKPYSDDQLLRLVKKVLDIRAKRKTD
jgi:PAS domain S-box-containing protein